MKVSRAHDVSKDKFGNPKIKEMVKGQQMTYRHLSPRGSAVAEKLPAALLLVTSCLQRCLKKERSVWSHHTKSSRRCPAKDAA